MAFDPDAYLAAKTAPAPASPGGFDPDAYLASKGVSPQAPAVPGRLEALGRGALQGATLGFSDEITGALESIFSDKSYQQARDESRAANQAAADAHSRFYGAGEIGGGLASAAIPGLGIAEGAGLGAVAAKSALAGGLGALGESDKSLSDVGGVAKDVGIGAATGAAAGGLAHYVGSKVGSILEKAPEKFDEQTFKGIAGANGETSAPWKVTREALKDKNVPEVLKTKVDVGNGQLESASDLAFKPPAEIRQVIRKQSDNLTRERDAIYDHSDKSSAGVSSAGNDKGGISLYDLVKHFDELPNEVSTIPKSMQSLVDANGNAIEPKASASAHTMKNYLDAISLERQKILDTYAPQLAAALKTPEAQSIPKIREQLLKTMGSDIKIPSKEVRALATDYQATAADKNAETIGKDVYNFIGSKTKDFVNDQVEKNLGPAEVEALKANNAKTRALITVDNILKEREQRATAGQFSNQGLLERGLTHGPGLAGAGLAMMGHPAALIPAVALPALVKNAPQISRFATGQASRANSLLQSIVEAASKGNPWAQAQVRALRSSPVGAARLAQIASSNLLTPPAPEAQP